VEAFKGAFQDLGGAGLNQSQISECYYGSQANIEKQCRSVASKYSILVSKLEGLVGGYQQAYKIGLTEVLLVAAAVFLVCAALA
jgi:hypothetical protein